MQAVGGVKQIYRADTIFMNDYIPGAEAAANSYDEKQGKTIREEASKKRLKDEYEYWSNLALRLHFKYKVFSVNLLKTSLFPDNQDYESHKRFYKKQLETACLAYKYIYRTYRLNVAEEKKDIVDKDKARYPTADEKLLQWLEHRRWNAFLRTMGFQQTKNYEEYIETTESHKQMEEKLHPCLVECEKPKKSKSYTCFHINNICCKKCLSNQLTESAYHHKIIDRPKNYNIKDSVDFISGLVPCKDFDSFNVHQHIEDNLDMLDLLSLDLYKLKKEKFKNVKGFKPYDFKQYDYPNNDYLDNI